MNRDRDDKTIVRTCARTRAYRYCYFVELSSPTYLGLVPS